jgi:hypothetical protein
MDRNQARELLPIIQAYAEGKIIQVKQPIVGWKDNNEPLFNGDTSSYRIKPEPKFRPFKDAEECWQEMLKHQPFGWIKCYEGYLNITYVGDEQVYLADPDGGAILLDSENSYKDNTFVDGTPFGIKVEE